MTARDSGETDMELVNDNQVSSKNPNLFDFRLFADDSNLFCEHKNISQLEASINNELSNIYT